MEHVEMVVEYLTDGSDFQYYDNHGTVIRCKNCKHWMPYDWMFSEVWKSKNIEDYPEEEIGCAYCDMNMSANDFCSRGERNERTHYQTRSTSSHRGYLR